MRSDANDTGKRADKGFLSTDEQQEPASIAENPSEGNDGAPQEARRLTPLLQVGPARRRAGSGSGGGSGPAVGGDSGGQAAAEVVSGVTDDEG
jgi:hypothetical protein